MQTLTRNRRGYSRVELMIVIGSIAKVALIALVGVALIGAVDTLKANRAYDAVTEARYTDPELLATHDDTYADHCKAADDAVGYYFRATPPEGGDRAKLLVCGGSILSSKPSRVIVVK